MKIRINETGELTKLSMDGIDDMLGNYGVWGQEGCGYDDDADCYYMPAECYNWWDDYAKAQEKADDRVTEILDELNNDNRDAMEAELATIYCAALDDVPGAMHAICDEYARLTN